MLLLGRREPAREPTARRVGPALVQLLFVLLAEPTAAAWPIRKLGEAAGIGKTAAATGRERLVRLGILAGGRRRPHRVADRNRLVDEFLGGYTNVLRPQRTIHGLAVAHPWLVCGELLCQADPRALEAAEQVRVRGGAELLPYCIVFKIELHLTNRLPAARQVKRADLPSRAQRA